MGDDHIRPLGTGNNQGLQDGASSTASAVSLPHYSEIRLTCPGNLRGSKEDAGERRNNGGRVSHSGGVRLQAFPGTKEGRANETHHKPEIFEQVPGLSTLQDGKYPGCARCALPQRLVAMNRPQRC